MRFDMSKINYSKTHKSGTRCLIAILMQLGLGGSLPAQQTASLAGSILDSTSASIPSATVTLRNLGTNQERRTLTDASGRFSFSLIPAGTFELRAEKTGFKQSLQQGIQLAVGQSATVDLQLMVGSVTEQVFIEADASPVTSSFNETSGLVTGTEIRALPLNGRSYDQLLTLNPGALNFTAERTGGVGTSNSAVGNMFAISGRRPQENLFLLDGIEYTGASGLNQTPGGTSGQLLGVDALREFNVLPDTYSAAYGKRPGAQVLLVPDSGTNALHGAAYEFFRNSGMDARNYFDQGSIPEFQRNQFGLQMGAPLRHNRSFIFANYEGFRQSLSLSDVTLVPDNNARLGLLPGTNGTITNVGVSPFSAPLLALWPTAKGPELGGGIAESFSHPQQSIHEDFGLARLDQYLTKRDSLSATYLVDDSADNTPTANPLSLDIESLREQVASLRETRVVSSNIINLATFGYSRADYYFTSAATAGAPSFIAGRPTGAVIIGGSATPNTASSITAARANTGANHDSTRNLFTYADTLSYSRGRHSLTMGAWLQRVQFNDDLALGQFGQATFSTLQSFLQGTVTTFTAVPSPTPMDWRSLETAAFLQDQIRFSSRLTVSLGFRYEGTNGWNEANGRASTFILGANGVLQTTPRVSSSEFTINRAKLLPQPRVGFAWDAFGTGKTVVRGGFGLYNDPQDALGYRADQNAPFNTSITLKNVPLSQLPLTPGQSYSGNLVAPNGIQQDLYTPTVISYNLRIEQLLTPNTVLRIGYVGSHGYHETISEDLNQANPIICPAPACPASIPAGTIYHSVNEPLANPQLASGWTWISAGDSFYNALQVDLHKRYANGLDFRAVYTWAKSLDDGDSLNASGASNAPGLAEDPHFLKLDWGRSTFDVRNTASINDVYELPFGSGRRFLSSLRGIEGLLASNWAISGILTYQGGYPFTPELSFNPSNNGDTSNPVRPSLNPAFHGQIVTGGSNQYFNPAAFIVPQAGTYGDVSRDSFTGPSLVELDNSLSKTTRLTERLSLQLRGDAFNILNHSNFNAPNVVVFSSATAPASGSAGIVTSTATTSRQLQVSAKLLW
jgi:hypothetical protein